MSVSPTSAVNSYSASQSTSKTNKNELAMEDFFTLLAAQLSNQDMMNPVSDTDFLSQMAQYSAISSSQQLNNSFSNLIAVSYIGKNVSASTTDENGKSVPIEGVVSKVEFSEGKTYLTVNDKQITPDQITEVSNSESSSKTSTDTTSSGTTTAK